MLDFRTLWQKVVQKRNTIVKEKSNVGEVMQGTIVFRHLFWDAWLGTSYQKSRRRLPPQAVPENPLFEQNNASKKKPELNLNLWPRGLLTHLRCGGEKHMYIYIMSYIYIYTYIDRKGYKFGLSELESRDYVAISKVDLCSGCSSTCSNNCHTLRCQDV